MDDPGLAWPFWKFGLKREDLFSKLHDQYNTFSSSIQDPEAFHHDVFEISHEARTRDDFYRLLADRKQQRLRELNDSLESAAVEIIANPSLIGTEQWQHALQLFRDRSLDALVRYFASYIPKSHRWHHARRDLSGSEAGSSVDSIAHSDQSFFGDDDVDTQPDMMEEPLPISEEPLPLSEAASHKEHLPPSPQSIAMYLDSSAASPVDADAHDVYILDNLSPARTLSFSGSESEGLALEDSLSHSHEETSQPSDTDSMSTSVSDLLEPVCFQIADVVVPAASECPPTQEAADDDMSPDPADSETPTPKPTQSATPFFDTRPSLYRRRHRSCSPSRSHPLSHADHDVPPPHSARQPARIARLRRREGSPRPARWRSPGEPATRVQKPLLDTSRSRAKGRRRMECQ